MKIIGISNQQFTGVTVATRANCTGYMSVGHLDLPLQVQSISQSILRQTPDLLLVGGWSRGYDRLLQELKKTRRFPVVACYHSTVFHGKFFGDEIYMPAFERAYHEGSYDVMAFVQPQTARYYRNIRKIQNCAFLPHAFKLQTKSEERQVFRIGVFGGLAKWHKNSYGALEVAKDFCKNNPNCEVVSAVDYDLPHAQFLEQMGSCSVLLHISHLECYSNMIQEAWARGIPTITSAASSGLIYANPLLSQEDKRALSKLDVKCATDAYDLYQKIGMVKDHWEEISALTHDVYARLSDRTTKYVNDFYSHVIIGHRIRSIDPKFFKWEDECQSG